MIEATLVIKPKSEYESDFVKLLDEYLLNFEDGGWEGNEDIKEIAEQVLNDYSFIVDDSMIPVIVANMIIRHEQGTGYVIGGFEKQLILRYTYILIYRSKFKTN